ncbi:MAG TPA: PAS domain-containing protein, partial [bacterium]|nr:PAS domain-containing protein [bacterium]
AERRARREQQQASSLLDGLVEALPFGISVKDPQGRYLVANHALLRFYGLPQEAMLGQRTEQLRGIARQQARVATEMDQEVLRTGRLARRDNVAVQDSAGRTHYRTLYKAPLRDYAGRLIGMVGFTEDVTERHQAEEALRASQRLLRTVFDTIPHRLAVKDPQGRYLAVNLAEAHARGSASASGASAPARTRGRVQAQAEEAPALAALERQATARKTRMHLPMHRTLDPNGQEHIQDVTKLPILNEQGDVEAVLTLAQDITQRVHAEEQARRSARLLQTVFDAIPERLYVKDLEGRHVMVNHAHAAFYGLTPQQMAGLHTRDVPVAPDAVKKRALAEDRAVISSGTVMEIPELESVDSRGRPSTWHLVKLPLRDDSGRIVGLVGLAHDITARKQVERELVEKQRLLEAAQHVAALGTWIGIPGEPGRVQISPESARMYGIALHGFSGLADDALRHVPPEERAALLAAARECILNDTPVDMEHRVLHPDGTVRWVHQRGQVERNAKGRPLRIIGVAQDITERKRAEEAIRASQRLLETVFSAIPHDVFVKDAQGRLLMVNEAMARTYHMEPQAMVGLTARQLPGATAEMIETFVETDREVLQSGHAVETIRQIRRGPGREPRWYRELKAPLRDDTGQVMGLVGMAEDIHERMRTEQELSANRRLLRAVFDTIPHAMFVKDPDSVYLMVNGAQARLFGLKPEQMVGMPTRQLPGVTPQTIESWIRDDQAVLQSGERRDITEAGYRYISGREMWL